MNELPSLKTDKIDVSQLTGRNISLYLARLDLIHPIVSGNKIFKLQRFLESARSKANDLLITAGGAYSNHLLATAYACKEQGIRAIGLVRGEKPEKYNSTLNDCIYYGMDLHFVSRESYKALQTAGDHQWLTSNFGQHLFIPEGGFDPMGAAGASVIPELIRDVPYTHLCTAVGTGTTLAGLAQSKLTANKTLIGFSALKDMSDIEERFRLLQSPFSAEKILIENGYSFGGYARQTPELLRFMNSFYRDTGIPTDFVYTGKMLFGIMDMICKEKFPEGSQILCLHTGGLQGNRSLPPGIL